MGIRLALLMLNQLKVLLKDGSAHFDDEFWFVTRLTLLYEEHQVFLSALLGRHGNAHFAEKFKETAVPFMLQMYKIPDDNLNAQLVLEFHLSGILSALAFWYHKGQKEISLADFRKVLITKK